MRTHVVRCLAALVVVAGLAAPGAAQAPVQAEAVEIRVVTPRLLALLEFALAATGRAESPRMYRTLLRDAPNVITDTGAVARFAGMDLDENAYTYSGYPAAHGQTTSPWAAFRAATAKATGWDDLRDRTAGLLSSEQQETVLAAMRAVEPAYARLVEAPHGAAAELQARRLGTYLRERQVGALAHRIARFYGTRWPDGVPLYVALHPLPPGRSLRAGVTANVAIGGMPAGFDEPATFAALTLHELGHQLYGQQPVALARRIESVMNGGSSATRTLAYRWLDEALATATANGWAYARMAGTADTAMWYNDRIIDRYARALYPRVAEYLASGRTLDDAFLAHAAERFDAALPNARTDPDALLPFFAMVTDVADPAEIDGLIEPIAERSRLRGTSITTRFTDEGVRTSLRAPALTVILLTRPTAEKLALLARHLPDALLRAPAPLAFGFTGDGHPVLLLRAGSADEVRAALATIGSSGFTPLTR